MGIYTTAFAVVAIGILIWFIWFGVVSGLAKTLEESFRRL